MRKQGYRQRCCLLRCFLALLSLLSLLLHRYRLHPPRPYRLCQQPLALLLCLLYRLRLLLSLRLYRLPQLLLRQPRLLLLL